MKNNGFAGLRQLGRAKFIRAVMAHQHVFYDAARQILRALSHPRFDLAAAMRSLSMRQPPLWRRNSFATWEATAQLHD